MIYHKASESFSCHHLRINALGQSMCVGVVLGFLNVGVVFLTGGVARYGSVVPVSTRDPNKFQHQVHKHLHVGMLLQYFHVLYYIAMVYQTLSSS